MRKVLDLYFRFPVFIDYVLGLSVVGVMNYNIRLGILKIPKDEIILSLASETTTILLTLAGFILTFLTILITFKTGNLAENKNPSLMEKFCNSSLYKETTKLLKGGIKSLIFTTLVIYVLRFVNMSDIWVLYYWIMLSIIVLLLTILRALFILENILNFHTE